MSLLGSFEGGGIGSSKSTTYSSSTNAGFSDIHDSSLNNLQGVSLSANGKNGVTNLSILDGGAIKESFDFGKAALDFSTASQSQAYDFSKDVVTETSVQIADAIDAVSASARSETENILISLQKYALYGFLIWGAVQVFRGAKN